MVKVVEERKTRPGWKSPARAAYNRVKQRYESGVVPARRCGTAPAGGGGWCRELRTGETWEEAKSTEVNRRGERMGGKGPGLLFH